MSILVKNRELSRGKDSRNLFIDFLKGICILCVVITHNLPPTVMKYTIFIVWGGMAVPLFLLIQCYHVFHTDFKRRNIGIPPKSLKEQYNLKKIWKRIIGPFIIVTLLTGSVLVIIGHDPIDVLKNAILCGGIGPGSYYVWIYLQFFILLPLCLILINKTGKGILTLLLFVIVSQGLEWICMSIDIPEHIYRLLCFRYIFLIYLGYLWVSNRMSRTLTSKQLILSFISLALLLFLYYSSCSLKPILHDSNWRSFHWICYFYTALLLPWVIWKVFDRIPTKVREFIGNIGKLSYEIFLIQMLVFTLYPHSLLSVGNKYLDWIYFFGITLIVSVIPVVIWNRYKEKIDIHRIKKNGN